MNHQEQRGSIALKQCRSGLVALQNGLIFPAVKQLREALESLQKELDFTNAPLSSHPDVMPIAFSPALVANEKRASPNNDFCFCLRGFDVATDECTDKDLVASVLMYNFAFAMHIHGINTGNSRHLQRALVLYRKTKTLVDTKHQDMRYAHLALALWTNLGHISSHFLMHEGVQVCREKIRMFLWHTPRTCLEECDFVFFSGVLLTDFGRNSKNAAAA